jgi:CheY-specific phosphatase CheX
MEEKNLEKIFDKAFSVFAETYDIELTSFSEWEEHAKSVDFKKYNVLFEIIGNNNLNFFWCIDEIDINILLKKLLNYDGKEINEEVVSFFCELGNVFIGNLGNMISSEDEIFQYSPPLLITGSNLIFKSNNKFSSKTYYFGEFKITLIFSERY